MSIVKRKIKLAGYTQDQFADMLKISRAYLSTIVNKKATPSPPLAKKIAELLGTTIEELNFF